MDLFGKLKALFGCGKGIPVRVSAPVATERVPAAVAVASAPGVAEVPAVPRISTWSEFHHHLRRLDYDRGRDFSLGVEMGFGEHGNGLLRMLRSRLHDWNGDSGIKNSLVAAGVEYGELLAECADSAFHSDAQSAYRIALYQNDPAARR
jgi:hypothetical protein